MHPRANIYSANICEQKDYGLVLAFVSKLNGNYYTVIDNEGVIFNGWPYSNIKDFEILWGQIISINVYPTANYGRYMFEVDAPGSFGEGLRDENFGEITDFCVESVRIQMQKLGLQQKFFKKTR